MFEKLKSEIDKLQQQEKTLRGLLAKLKSPQFDHTDTQLVQQKLRTVQFHLLQCSKQLQIKTNLYNTNIKQIENLARERIQVLDHCDQAFQDFPDLLHHFAHKQARLNQSLLSIKHKLQT